eukprot:scaffold108_cov167-Ochromonas_danica.AAC.1
MSFSLTDDNPPWSSKNDYSNHDAQHLILEMLPDLVPKSLQRIAKLSSSHREDAKGTMTLPSNEMARLLILKQCKVLDTDRNDIEFDRFVALAKRIFHAPIAMISFIDYDRQWIKSCVGGKISNPNVPRSDSIDADLMFPDAHEIKLILNGDEQDKMTRLVEKLGLREQLPLRFYIGAAIIIDGFKLGVLSLFDNEPHDY